MKKKPAGGPVKVADKLREKLGRAPVPEMPEIAGEFIHLAGGPKNFAKELWTEYQAAEAGSLMRQRMLDLVLRCMKGGGSQLGGDDLRQLDEDELNEILVSLVTEAGLADADAPAGPPAPAGHPGDAAEGPQAEAPAPAAHGPR